MERKEWVQRCAKALNAGSDLTWQKCQEFAARMADEQHDDNGASGIAWQSPEDAAAEYLEWMGDDDSEV